MGRWVEILCGCADPNVCTHPRPARPDEGVAYETNPGDIMWLGRVLGTIDPDRRVFEIFAKIGDFEAYEGELLVLDLTEVPLWEMEVDAAEDLIFGVQGREWELRSAWLDSQTKPWLKLNEDPEKALRSCKKLCLTSLHSSSRSFHALKTYSTGRDPPYRTLVRRRLVPAPNWTRPVDNFR